MLWIKRRKPTESIERTQNFTDLLEMLQLVSTQLATHDKEIDLIKVRLKNRAFKQPDAEETSQDAIKEKPTDPFDHIRAMKKDLYNEKIGI